MPVDFLASRKNSNICLIRCEYSKDIGYGHLVRCLTLGYEMKQRGLGVYFLSSSKPPDPQNGFSNHFDEWFITNKKVGSKDDACYLAKLAKKIKSKFIILDFYHISEPYQYILIKNGLNWLQFDGFADQPLWANYVVSMSPSSNENKCMQNKKNQSTVLLLGPRYAVLHNDFKYFHKKITIKENLNQVLISFGGGNDYGMTLFCLNAIFESGWDGKIVAIVGKGNPNSNQIVSWAKDYSYNRVKIHIDERHMAKVMSDCDMAIISGGMITFEAACLGLPSLMICFAKNQEENIHAWSQLGFAEELGDFRNLTKDYFIEKFFSLVRDRNMRAEMSRIGMQHVDGEGANRVIGRIMEIFPENL